ncbi:MAG TPA: tRNA (guanosine(46)-N7)-methyltransferase TrmB [Bacteroidales bacterium]|nr:tRNA (guanosine(46)-N7)-methyltransferase TrmB [Bacteroidota bacterium]HNV67370.1 tRNA (guanosine(46)-N7)-methyltransferase TrmB [Bacteroidales bacterium]HNY57530.1 tRNA (guanosine(46)-N7)-methyltransferase TrmB [Bacteroidales bacterium]HOC04635.1 tRNA (guanosine(46)-N7)-methyltransferase TrmB [Bacteroidales bacterium]HOE24619.1 tRNA (guanosine(46)-N7)-methyltransferase TrmB [Bacteroidales bacterium]
MGKNKHARWAEMKGFDRVIEPSFEEVFRCDHELKGKWHAEWFGNSNPITLELGCGRGEYTVGLAGLYPAKNIIGIDIKGARMWRGARDAHLMGLPNSTFIRTRIEFTGSLFAPGEIDEIWLTFPDPRMKRAGEKKRLSGPHFLNLYRQYLKDGGIVHLKTDCRELYDYTLALAKANGLAIITSVTDLHREMPGDPLLSIRTHYEEIFLNQGIPITYLSFRLPNEKEIVSPGG